MALGGESRGERLSEESRAAGDGNQHRGIVRRCGVGGA